MTQVAFACGDPSSSPVIFSIGKFKPIPSKNILISVAAICGLAVSTNRSLLPNLPCLLKAKSASGPFWVPLPTFSKLVKSNVAPFSCNSLACSANLAADISIVVPSALLTITFSFVLANVSSKSKTLIPFGFVFKDLDNLLVVS